MTSSTILIKIGGALVGADGAPEALWTALRALQAEHRVVLLHGGGPHATAVAQRLGHTPRLIHGRRVTTDLDLEIILWTLRGAINARLAAQAWRYGLPAVGVSGADDGLVQVEKRPPRLIDGETVDFGWVGDVTGVRVDVLNLLLDTGRLPVLAPMGIDADGHLYNVNADTVAVAIATALHADRLLLVAASGGVRRVADDPLTHLPCCSETDFETGRAEGWITDGMRVKLTVAFEARRAGIPDVFIVSPDDVLTPENGTRIVVE